MPSPLPTPDAFVLTQALIREVQRKIGDSLSGQTHSHLLTYGCALVGMALPLDDDADFPDRPDSLIQESLRLNLQPQNPEPAVEAPTGPPCELDEDGYETADPAWGPGPEGPVSQVKLDLCDFPPLPGDPPPHGFLVVTMAGEAFWLTPTHLKALDEAGVRLYGAAAWHGALGFRSSPSAHSPVHDIQVTLTVAPGLKLGTGTHYHLTQYVPALRSHQDVVLLSAEKPAGFPW
jgi:hypothetical protein